MIIALMGNDGCGKTTIAKLLASRLKELKLDAEYRVGFDYGLLNLLLKHVLKIKPDGAGKESRDWQKRLKGVLKIWPFLVFLDCFFTHTYIKLKKRGKIVIFDRYFYDFLIGYEYEGQSNVVVRKLFLSLPKPDLGFILDVSPEVAYERKRGSDVADLSFYRVQRRRYIKLAHALGIDIANTRSSTEDLVVLLSSVIQTKLERDMKTANIN